MLTRKPLICSLGGEERVLSLVEMNRHSYMPQMDGITAGF